MSQPPTRKSKNCLSRVQQRRLEDWCLAHRDVCEDPDHSIDTVATRASSALGFIVKGYNIRHALNAVEISLANGRERRGVPRPGEKSAPLAILFRKVADLTTRLTFIESQLGIKPPTTPA